MKNILIVEEDTALADRVFFGMPLAVVYYNIR